MTVYPYPCMFIIQVACLISGSMANTKVGVVELQNVSIFKRFLRCLIFLFAGFRDREDLNTELSPNSVELTNSQHSRTHSDGGNGPPHGKQET